MLKTCMLSGCMQCSVARSWMGGGRLTMYPIVSFLNAISDFIIMEQHTTKIICMERLQVPSFKWILVSRSSPSWAKLFIRKLVFLVCSFSCKADLFSYKASFLNRGKRRFGNGLFKFKCKFNNVRISEYLSLNHWQLMRCPVVDNKCSAILCCRKPKLCNGLESGIHHRIRIPESWSGSVSYVEWNVS